MWKLIIYSILTKNLFINRFIKVSTYFSMQWISFYAQKYNKAQQNQFVALINRNNCRLLVAAYQKSTSEAYSKNRLKYYKSIKFTSSPFEKLSKLITSTIE